MGKRFISKINLITCRTHTQKCLSEKQVSRAVINELPTMKSNLILLVFLLLCEKSSKGLNGESLLDDLAQVIKFDFLEEGAGKSSQEAGTTEEYPKPGSTKSTTDKTIDTTTSKTSTTTDGSGEESDEVSFSVQNLSRIGIFQF